MMLEEWNARNSSFQTHVSLSSRLLSLKNMDNVVIREGIKSQTLDYRWSVKKSIDDGRILIESKELIPCHYYFKYYTYYTIVSIELIGSNFLENFEI